MAKTPAAKEYQGYSGEPGVGFVLVTVKGGDTGTTFHTRRQADAGHVDFFHTSATGKKAVKEFREKADIPLSWMRTRTERGYRRRRTEQS